MEVTLAKLAAMVGGELHGNPDACITGVATLAGADSGQLSFFSNSKYRKYLADTRAGVVLLAAGDIESCPVPCIVVKDPYVAYAKAAQFFNPPSCPPAGIHPSAVVDPSVTLGSDVSVGAGSVIEAGCELGDGVIIGPGCTIGREAYIGPGSRLVARVTIMHGCTLGARIIIHPGVVIGADGFGIANDDGRWIKVPQLGAVRIGDDCEIGANTTIDRGALEDTVLEEGVKLDNQIMVAHNVHIGAHTVVAGCVGIAGSTRIGKRCLIAGACGISGHLNICDDVMIMAMSMVTSDIHQPGQYASGLPLDTLANWRRNGARFRKLDELAKRVKQLEQNRKKD